MVKTWLEHVSNVSIGSSYIGVVSEVLVDLMFFRIFFMGNSSVAMEGVRCFIRSTVILFHVEKLHLLMCWSNNLRTGLNSVTW